MTGPRVAVIPARGGSKGIPRKNVLPVAGKPLVVWTIEQALSCDRIDLVVVSTEDAEIAAVARAAGAEVVHRPQHLAQDDTATEPVVVHALHELARTHGTAGLVVLLQATSPVRLPGTLDRAVEQFEDDHLDSLVGVVAQGPFLWWAGDRNQPPRADYDWRHRPRRQDLAPGQLRYRETGSLYVTAPHLYLAPDQPANRLGGRIGLFVMDELEGTDIDTPHDLALAEQTLLTLTTIPGPPR